MRSQMFRIRYTLSGDPTVRSFDQRAVSAAAVVAFLTYRNSTAVVLSVEPVR